MLSGQNDGVGVAVAPEAISAEQFAQVVGQAWESSTESGVKSVRVAVGLIRHDPTVQRLIENHQAQAEQLATLEARMAALEQARPAANAVEPSMPVSWQLVGALLPLAFVLGRRARR